MNIGKNFRYKSLLIYFMAVIFLCSAAVVFGTLTVKSVVLADDKIDVTLTLDGVLEGELASRIYGDSYAPITATAVETVSGNLITGYGYVIQYNDETMSGAWTTTVPRNADRYAVRAYGAATATYNEAISDVAYLVIVPRTLKINFIDDYKISNTEGGTRQYNGQPYRIRAEFTNVVLGDNLVPITGGGNAINASDTPYKFNVYGFSAPNAAVRANYYMKNTAYPYLITKVPMTVVWSDLEHTYDGTQKDPTVEWVSAPLMPAGDPEAVAAERINAGSYTVTAEYNGEDSGNFEIVNPTETFTIGRINIGISLSARASYGNEAILKALINPTLSDPIPTDEIEYVQTQISSATLETNWTPTSNPNQVYYAYLAGHNENRYLDYDLMPNYVVEWRRAIYYPSKANVVSIEWSENDYTYNVAEQTITAAGLTDFGSIITLEITVNKEFKNAANDYVATAAISASDAPNIQFGYGVATTKDYEIKKAPVTIVWSDLTHTYDGTQKDTTVEWETAPLMPAGDPEAVAVERINAGSYTVTAEYNGADKDNFTMINDTETLVISPIELVIIWNDANGGTKVYDGTEYIVGATFTNLVFGDTLIPVITGDSGINASETPYVKTVTDFTAEGVTIAENYVLPSTSCEYSYTITKRNVTVAWSNTSLTYNAAAQNPTAAWTDSVALNAGSELVVTGEQVNAGSHTATASISGAGAINFTITNISQSFTIEKATATIVWSNLTHTYDGTQKDPTVEWETAPLMPAGDPEAVAAERINAGSYTVTADYNGADKDNFIIVNVSDALIIDRADLIVTITLTESSVTFGGDFSAEISANWRLTSEQSNNEFLASLISGYSAGDDTGVYTITLDFDKAEDESRHSPETFIDNYRIAVINEAALTVNKKEITSSEIAEWVNNGDIIFNGETVLYDGNVHMIYADINGSARGVIKVGEYLVDGNPFDGASEAADYNVTAVIVPVNGNYTAEGLTVSAILQIYENDVTVHEPENVANTSGGGNVGGDLPIISGGSSVSDLIMTLFLIIVIIVTVFGFIAILVIVKKFRDEIAE